MITIKVIYDSESKRLMFDFTCSLLSDHYSLFEKEFSKSKKEGFIPGDFSISRVEKDRCMLVLPIVIPGIERAPDNQSASALVPKELINKITSLLNDFRAEAIKDEIRTTEFIPLSGYSVKNLQKDIVTAIKAKRNFCLIESYSDYQKFENREISRLRQYKVKHSTNDYSEIALSIYEGNLKRIKDQYTPKLEEVDWE